MHLVFTRMPGERVTLGDWNHCCWEHVPIFECSFTASVWRFVKPQFMLQRCLPQTQYTLWVTEPDSGADVHNGQHKTEHVQPGPALRWHLDGSDVRCDQA